MIFRLDSIPDDDAVVVERINELIRQLKYATSDDRRHWAGVLIRSTFAPAIRGSNSVKGYKVTGDDAVAAVDNEEPLDEKTEDWSVVLGYRETMTYILRLADDPHFTHNTGTLNALHYMMVGFDYKANPGRWRRGAIWVRNQASGQTPTDRRHQTLGLRHGRLMHPARQAEGKSCHSPWYPASAD